MKLKKTIAPLAASLLLLAACGPTGTSTSSLSSRPVASSSAVDPVYAAAENAIGKLGSTLAEQGLGGLHDRTFELQTTIESDGYDFDVVYTMKANPDYLYEGCEATLFTVANQIRATVGEGKDAFDFYLATSGTFDTVSATAVSNYSDSGRNTAHLFSSMPTDPDDLGEEMAAGTYKIGFYQKGLGKWLFINGLMDGYYFGTTDDYSEAAEITVEAMEGGFSLKITKMTPSTPATSSEAAVDNTGKYLAGVKDGKYTNVAFTDTPFAWTTDASHTYVSTTCVEEDPELGEGPAVYILFAAVLHDGVKMFSDTWNIRIDPLKITKLADVPSMTNGSAVVTYGIYTGGYNSGAYSDDRYHWVADGEAGMTIYGEIDKNIKVGDILKISGEYSPYSGLPEIAPTSVEVVDPKEDSNAAAVKAAVTIEYTGQELTSSMISLPIKATGEIASGSGSSDKYSFSLKISEGVAIDLYGENDKDGADGFKAMSALKKGDKVTINGWLGNHNGTYQIIAGTPTTAAE